MGTLLDSTLCRAVCCQLVFPAYAGFDCSRSVVVVLDLPFSVRGFKGEHVVYKFCVGCDEEFRVHNNPLLAEGGELVR